MTEMRSTQWRVEQGLSVIDADHRIDEAIAVITASQFIYSIGLTVNGADFFDKFATAKIKSPNSRAAKFDPDYLCFLAYALKALEYVNRKHPECEKLDFVVERNGSITKHIQEFHSQLSCNLSITGRPDLSKLVGELIPSGKDKIPVQVADVLCWHTARAIRPNTMDEKDRRRYECLPHRNGSKQAIDSEMLAEMAAALLPR